MEIERENNIEIDRLIIREYYEKKKTITSIRNSAYLIDKLNFYISMIYHGQMKYRWWYRTSKIRRQERVRITAIPTESLKDKLHYQRNTLQW